MINKIGENLKSVYKKVQEIVGELETWSPIGTLRSYEAIPLEDFEGQWIVAPGVPYHLSSISKHREGHMPTYSSPTEVLIESLKHVDRDRAESSIQYEYEKELYAFMMDIVKGDVESQYRRHKTMMDSFLEHDKKHIAAEFVRGYDVAYIVVPTVAEKRSRS